MKFEAEGTGKKIEEAIENALLELKVPREDVDIKIIDQGGFFKKAKVLVSISEDARVKYEKKVETRKKIEDEEKPKEQPKPARKIVADEEIVVTKKADKKVEVKEEKPKTEKPKVDKPKERPSTPRRERTSGEAKSFLEGLIKVAGKKATIEEKVMEDGSVVYNVTGENMSDFIGHRGDALYSISYLTSTFAGRDEKVRVDVEGYRERRMETLKALALRVAEKVARTGRYAKLEPMEAGERRIIHMVLQESTEVDTISKGQEPHRFLMVVPKKGIKPQLEEVVEEEKASDEE